MKRRFSLSIKGFNLPELVISILLLSTVVIIIIGIFTGAVIGIRKGANQVIVTNVLSSTMEQYSQTVLYDFNNPLYSNGKSYKISESEPVDSLTLEEKWVSFQEMGSSAKNRIKTITVTIYWYDKNLSGTGGERKKSGTTCINNYLDY